VSDSAWKVLADATLRASIELCRREGIDPSAEELSAALKSTLKENMPRILDEWIQAVGDESQPPALGPGWLRELVNVQAWELASEALEKGGLR
jgi:hypothetical protein